MSLGRINSVQYLRALAALSVVVAHAWNHPSASPNLDAERLGEFGVVLFFVISGFIMVTISGAGPFSALEFLRRRAIRVVPLYWIFTSLTAFTALLLPTLFKTTVFTWPHYLLSLLFIPHADPAGGSSPLLHLGWTLNYEIWFYICFALLAGALLRRRLVLLTLAFAGLAGLGAVWHSGNAMLDFYLDRSLLAFCAGCWIGQAFLTGRLQRLPKLSDPALGMLAIAGVVLAFAYDRTAPPDVAAFAGFVLFSGAVLALGLRAETRLPANRLLLEIGDASYAMYLVHMFVVGALSAVAFRLLPFSSVAADIGVIVACLLASTAAGIAVHRLIELPLLQLMRGPSRKLQAENRPATA
jgi:exopolysaccharide production protein ExoZ